MFHFQSHNFDQTLNLKQFTIFDSCSKVSRNNHVSLLQIIDNFTKDIIFSPELNQSRSIRQLYYFNNTQINRNDSMS